MTSDTHSPGPADDPRSDDEAPEVYAVRRERDGWSFAAQNPSHAGQAASAARRPDPVRRRLLTGLGVAATAATTQACGLTDKVREVISGSTPTPEQPTATPSPSPSPTGMPTATPTATPATTPTPSWGTEVATGCDGLYAHTGSLVAMAVAGDPGLLATAAVGDTVKVWSLPAGGLVASLDYIAPIAFTATGLLLAATAAGDVAIVPLDAGSAETFMPTGQGVVTALTVSKDNMLLATGGNTGTVKVWSIPAASQYAGMEGHPDDVVIALALSPDGSQLASGTVSGSLKLWSTGDNDLVGDLTGHEGFVYALAFTADGQTLASAGQDGSVRLWSAEGEAIGTIEPADGPVLYLATTPDGSRLVCSGQRAVTVWSLPDGDAVSRLETTGDEVTPIAMSADGQWLAIGDSSGTLRVCSLPDLTVVAQGPAHTASIKTVAFSSDGSLIVTGSKDGTVRLWSVPSATFQGCLVDVASVPPDVQVSTYSGESAGGTVTFTLPCGSAIPADAVCVCNCVAGSTPICGCVGDSGCGCVGDNACACDSYTAPCSCDSYSSGGSHYWYPN